jgi:hypothetical protein
VAVHEDAALPILISTAIIKALIAPVLPIVKYISPPALSVSSAAPLGKRWRCGDAEYQNAKCDFQSIDSHNFSSCEKVGESTGPYLK